MILLLLSAAWPLRIALVLIAILPLAFAISLLIRRRSEKRLQAYRELQLEHRSVNALLNPHFVFNAISNIQGLIRSGSGDQAENYLQELSRLMRRNIENLGSDLISLTAELELIRTYVNLHNLRGGPALSLSVSGLASISEAIAIPPLLIHSFVENAIVHGWIDGCAMEIQISLELSVNGYLIVSVCDNGRGVDAAASSRPDLSRTHVGLAFNRERLFRLNRFYNLDQSVHIADRFHEGEQGTRATIIVHIGLAELFHASGHSSLIR